MRQLRLRPSLFPRCVSPEHFCHPLICGKGTQFEALDEEEILKFDLEIHSILSSSLTLVASALTEGNMQLPCKTEDDRDEWRFDGDHKSQLAQCSPVCDSLQDVSSERPLPH